MFARTLAMGRVTVNKIIRRSTAVVERLMNVLLKCEMNRIVKNELDVRRNELDRNESG